ncbi:MAG: heavy metal-associated domain-containing protein [Kofleriaceae bacterium]
MTTTLSIAGMTCNNCVRHVSTALKEVPGVAKVQVNLPDSAIIDHDDLTTLPALVAAVESAGYTAAQK